LPLLALFMLMTACGGAPAPTNPPPAPTTPPALPTTSSGGSLVARVNGAEIMLADFEAELARRGADNSADAGALRADVLNQMIETTLIEQGAAGLNISVSSGEVAAEMQAMKDSAGGDANWQAFLTGNGYTSEAELAASLRLSLLTNRVRDYLTADLSGNVRQAWARHVLVRTEAEAQAALSRLNGGEPFEQVAAALSLDETTRAAGGDLGWFTLDELVVPELAMAVFNSQAGQLQGPIITELGYHIVQAQEFAERPVEPERQAYIAQNRFETWLQGLYSAASIERFVG
jgi:parvulin-like peptidyl-prolyl isomerase